MQVEENMEEIDLTEEEINILVESMAWEIDEDYTVPEMYVENTGT
jgi:hypothetical protein